jgi:hypothetical protein
MCSRRYRYYDITIECDSLFVSICIRILYADGTCQTYSLIYVYSFYAVNLLDKIFKLEINNRLNVIHEYCIMDEFVYSCDMLKKKKKNDDFSCRKIFKRERAFVHHNWFKAPYTWTIYIRSEPDYDCNIRELFFEALSSKRI